MTSPDDGASVKAPRPAAPKATHSYSEPKITSPDTDEPFQIPSATIPFRASHSPASKLRPSLSFGSGSRANSSDGRRSSSLTRSGRSSVASPLGHHLESYDDIRSFIIRAFSPVVAVSASADTDQLVSRKGFKNGLTELLRPFGEKVTGKVVVRDSVSASRAWDDFGVRFVNLGDLAETDHLPQDSKDGDSFAKLEELMEKYVELARQDSDVDAGDVGNARLGDVPPHMSPYYKVLLQRLLSAQSLATHETFLHPVACVVAISSSIPAPIDTLRQLYGQTTQGNQVLPPYVNPEYLRYYVLVHDEDNDDIAKSSALYDQMKRHFGLHCHLLRLRGRECLPNDDDRVEFPFCEWLSPMEDLDNFVTGYSPPPPLFESDVTAVKAFIRELVAQSVVPHMEQKISLWNDQVASRRRGLSGRFMSIGKRWAGFGSGSRSTSTAAAAGGGASGNYDALQGFYPSDTPEALLRKLADYSFMLRDYKLASSIYELLRTDYGNDKAWKYFAGANEMCAISSLLNPLATAAKSRIDSFDQMLETALYSYLTRCSDPQDALRCVALCVELLKVRGRTAAEAAAKWAIRILEIGLVGSVGHVLVSERVATCFAAQTGTGSKDWGSKKRKAAFWNVIAADEWMRLGQAQFAAERLEDAHALYESVATTDGIQSFKEMSAFLEQLQLAVRIKTAQARQQGAIEADPQKLNGGEPIADETSEQLDNRNHRTSIVGPGHSLDAAPLSPIRVTRPDPFLRDDDFE